MFIFWQKWGVNPLPFFSKSAFFSTFKIIYNTIFWMNRGHRHLPWDEKRSFWKCSYFGKNEGLTPCLFFSKSAFFQNFMKSSTIPYFGWIEVTDIFLRWKEVFWKCSYFGKNEGLTPCLFFSKSAFFQNFMKSSTIPYFGWIEVTDIFLRWKKVFLKMFISKMRG